MFDPERHHCRSIRFKGYDYSQPGAYFVTICTYGRACLFGKIVDGEMYLNKGGQIVEKCWLEIPEHFPRVVLDAHVVMPNHVHGIVWIVDDAAKFNGARNIGTMNVGAKKFSPLPPKRPRGTSKTIGSIVRGFKIGVTKWFRKNTDVHRVWQRNYFEHIIRDNDALARIREYIVTNPAHWTEDRENPKRIGRSDNFLQALDVRHGGRS